MCSSCCSTLLLSLVSESVVISGIGFLRVFVTATKPCGQTTEGKRVQSIVYELEYSYINCHVGTDKP